MEKFISPPRKANQFMKAIQIHGYGHSDKLSSEDVPPPKTSESDVLVKIHDAGVNPMDWKVREGYMKDAKPAKFPLTMGQDFAGQVIEVGSKVQKFKVGDRVFGFAQGTYTEYAAIPEDKIASMPKSADFVTAAALPTPGLTAYQILMDIVQAKEKDRILIHGAAGAVGSFLVQMAKHLKAEVIAHASAEDKDFLLRIGASQVIDYKTQRFEEQVQDLDVIIDLVGGDTAKRSYQAVKKGGILLSTVGAADPKEGEKFGIRTHSFLMKPDAGELEKLADLVDQRIVAPRVDRVVPFNGFREAQDLVQSGQAHGKIILEVLQ